MRFTHKQSYLSYPITRHYPFPWLDWVVAVLFVITVVVFTIINLAISGYNMETIYTLDPNTTLSSKHWYQKAPWSWINSASVTCQSSPIAKGDSIFTSNLGLIYTVDKVTSQGNTQVPSPGFPYLNTTLQNCSVTGVDIIFQRREYSLSNEVTGNFWTWDSSWASAAASCSVIGDHQLYRVNLVATLPTIRDADNNGLLNSFVNLTNTTRPAIWLGANLMNVWYTRLAMLMSSQEEFSNGTRLDSAQMYLYPNPGVSDITSPDFFRVLGNVYTNAYGIFVNNPQDQNMTIGQLQNNYTQIGTTYADVGHNKLAQMAANADVFSKSFYATVLADLGQSSAFQFLPGVDGVQYLISALGNVSGGVGGSANTTFMGLPSATAWDTLKSTLPLTINTATIYSQYPCSVAKIKSTPSLLISIFIADFVLLQAAWQIAKWFIGCIMSGREEEMNYCEGCIHREEATIPLTSSLAEKTTIPRSCIDPHRAMTC